MKSAAPLKHKKPEVLSQGEFNTWGEARSYAERRAVELHIAHGIEKPTPYSMWTVKMLPGKAFRFGWELLCEPVEVPEPCVQAAAKPSDARKRKPGRPARATKASVAMAVRVTQDEREEYKRAAAAAGLSVSAWVRSVLNAQGRST